MEAEQRRFRSLVRTDGPAPFGFLPPFCPCPGIPATECPALGTIEIRDGWIIRPLLHCPDSSLSGEVPTGWPDFLPDLPRIPGFILGYAGDGADRLLARAGETADPAGLPIRVWYHAALTADILHEGSSFVSARFEIGPARWVRRIR